MYIETYSAEHINNKKLLNTNIGTFLVSNYTFENICLNNSNKIPPEEFLYYIFDDDELIDKKIIENLIINYFDIIINNIISKRKFTDVCKIFIYYFDKFELYKKQDILYKFINNFCLKVLSLNQYKKYFQYLEYSVYLEIVKTNINKKHILVKIIDFFPINYLVKQDTIEELTKSRFSLDSMHFFKRLEKSNKSIESVFSFTSTISLEKAKKFLKPKEDEIFISFLLNSINKDYFNNIAFSSLVIPYKNIFKESVPLNIKKQLIDNICKRYRYDCLDIFEGEFHLLTIDELIKLFSYSSFYKTNSCLEKLRQKNHPILSEPNQLMDLILKNPKIFSLVDAEKLSFENLKLISSKLNIDLKPSEKCVRVHQDIKNFYKFEYDNYEYLPNGIYYSNFFNMTFENNLDKFLFNFLIYSRDIELIYDSFYEKYKSLIIKKYGEEKFKKLDDIYNFMKFVLTEKKVDDELVMPNLEIIYQKLNLTNNQVRHIKELMVTIDSRYEERINRFLIRQRNIALSKYNAIVRMHLDGVNISEALSKLGLKKDEVISQIIKMRNLDKKEKRALINLLKEEKYVITIGDILGILQEMEENDYTIDDALRLNGINKKYFYELYKNIIYTNPELHAKIKEALLNNKKKGFKKYIRLAYYITTFEFNSEDDFKTMFPNLDLDKMIENMEKLEKKSLVTKLKELKFNIKPEVKTLK